MTNNPTPAGVTVTLQNIRSQNGGEEVVLDLLLANGEQQERRALTLTTGLYCALKPEKGILSPEQFEQLEEAAEVTGALRYGEHLLGYGANSRIMLSRKIMRHGFSAGAAEKAAGMLTEMGLIDEKSDMKREIERCAKKLWGANRIRAQLWGKGYARDLLTQADALLAEIDFSENCAALIRKHYGGVPDDPEARQRLLAGLARYGYTSGEIRDAIRIVKKGD